MPLDMDDTRTSPHDSAHGQEAHGLTAILWVHPEERLSLLPRGTTRIGRADDAGIRLTGDQVSRIHATVNVTSTGLVLRDEGSLNKVRCNRVELSEAHLFNNDVVRLGDWVGVVMTGVDITSPQHPLFQEQPGGIVCGPRSRSLWQTLERLAPGDLPIVIEGESGTGKEVVAQAIHRLSRRTGRYVPVNCAAQPEGLFEASFFGHGKGAFTGANHSSEGFFVAASGGTLFLDEIVELAQTQQAKVLRAVEERQVTPVGATRARGVDVRIISAAQRPLALVADEGMFRADLLARLSGFTIRLLPLRERREEIPRLFRRAMTAQHGLDPKLSAGFVERICASPWRLNVRELVSTARRCTTLYPDVAELSSRHLAALLESGPALDQAKPPRVASGAVAGVESVLGSRTAAWLERHRTTLATLNQALEDCRGNLSKAAKQTGISRQRAQRLLQAAERED
jgi:two-component system response regulator FlrC